MNIPIELQLPYSKVELKIEQGIVKYLDRNKIEKIFMGISGGLDSSVTAYLAARAIGSERIVGVMMNDIVTTAQDKADAEKVIEKLGIRYLDVNVASTYANLEDLLKQELFSKFSSEELEKVGGERARMAYANLKPRLRMMILYFFDNRLNGRVVGTSDKSEILMGYFTKYGDGAADVLPIGDLYKTQVRALGEHLSLPENILRKKPSPGLIANLTAEQELGFDYSTADLVLHYKFDRNFSNGKIVKKLKVNEELVDRILSRVNNSENKRKMPEVIKISD